MTSGDPMLICCSSPGSLRGVVMMTRTPDNCTVKQKVIYSSSKKSFHSKCVGSKIIDAFDVDDLREENIKNKIL